MNKIINTIIGILGMIISTNLLLNYLKDKFIHNLIGTICIGLISILILSVEYFPRAMEKRVKIIKHKQMHQ